MVGQVNIADGILIRLFEPATRAAILDDGALTSLIAAGFDSTLDPLVGPHALIVDSAEFGVELDAPTTVHGRYESSVNAPPADIRLQARLPRYGEALRVDALWRGALVARRIPMDSVIEQAAPQFVKFDIDEALLAAGPLPADPVALEAARRAELLARLKATARFPEQIDARTLASMLSAAGFETVAALLDAGGSAALGGVRLRFSAPAPGAVPTPVQLPVTIAVFIREDIESLSAFLALARAARRLLADDAAVQPAPAPLPRRCQIAALLVLPAAALAQPGWPGANAAERRAVATKLLAQECIGLAIAPP
jgi:hypothetical protein